ncbi:MAG: hypothetical protein AB8B36_09280 [Prochlorococcus sp.]
MSRSRAINRFNRLIAKQRRRVLKGALPRFKEEQTSEQVSDSPAANQGQLRRVRSWHRDQLDDLQERPDHSETSGSE